jgi:hypothetical protein
LYLPHLILLNNIVNNNKNSIKKNKLQPLISTLSKKSKLISDSITNMSTNSSSKQHGKPTGLTEYQKHRKIAKKLKRAWNLNQKMPVNIFKKQVRYINHDPTFDSNKSETSSLTQDKNQYINVKCSGLKKMERKSKLKAKNKIKNSMLRQRKQRATFKSDREHLKYKRLVGLKRDIKDFLDNEDTHVDSQSSICRLDMSNGLSLDSNVGRLKSQRMDFHPHFGQIISPKLTNDSVDGGNSLKNKLVFEHVEFLDFSFKNINKPNFLVSND